MSDLRFPVIVKPTDSSGSKGVSKIENISEICEAARYALSFSRNKRFIVEEYVNINGNQLHGDGFVKDGRLIFSFLGDHHYDVNINPFVPFSTTWPSKIPFDTIQNVKVEVENIILKSGFRNGPVNIEARIDGEGKIYIMEIGPRSGGNFVPQAINHATGFDMVKAYLDLLSRVKITLPKITRKLVAYYVIHSEFNGRLVNLRIKEKLKPYICEFHQYLKPGESVRSFQGANAAIGIVLMKFDSHEEMDYIISNFSEFIDLKITKIQLPNI